MQEDAITANSTEHLRNKRFFPREHGATAMLLIPIVCTAILARQWHWAELATLVSAFSALAAKDPMVVLVRQRFIWKQPHPETPAAMRWLTLWLLVLASSGIVLLIVWPLKALLAMSLGVGVFYAVAILVNVKNRQRSTLFQIISAAALTSSSLATCLSATGTITRWCLWLWLLLAMQAAAGILVVHARLDARIALRATAPANHTFRRAAQIALVMLASAAIVAALFKHAWIVLALLALLAGYGFDLRSQLDPQSLQLPLKKVGQRSLALSCCYAIFLIVGFW